MAPTGAARQKFFFEFITTPTSDTDGTTLLLQFDHKRYIFGNVAEGTQRACTQRGIGLKKVKHVFLTGDIKWRNTGGLIGMILTLADAQQSQLEQLRSATSAETNNGKKVEAFMGDRSLMIHGSVNLMHTLACARGFVFRKGMPVCVNELEQSDDANLKEPTWRDENIRVWALPIAPAGSRYPDRDDIRSSDDIPSGSEASPGTSSKKRSHDQFKQAEDEIVPAYSPGQHLRDQEVRQRIVSHMFNSEWNRDALFETSLADVHLPAALFVQDPETKNITEYRGPPVGGEEPLPDIKVFVRKPWPGALIEDLPPARDIGFKPAMSYIVQGYPQRGQFDPAKAQALGVPRGPSYSSLAAGIPLTLENGTVVTPDMVLGPTKPGRGIAVVELPSRRYVSNLISRPEWSCEQIRSGIAAICWILAPGVASDPELEAFMKSMSNVEHIISSTDVCPNYLALDSCAASAIRLSRIAQRYFPVPFHDNVSVPQFRTSDDSGRSPLPPPGIAANRGLKIQVEPEFSIMRDEIPPLLNTAEVVQNVPKRVLEYARLAREKVAAESGPPNGSDAIAHRHDSVSDPEIITLGTGSAMPSKYRNVSGTLLRMGKYGNFLFDCGENTLGQLRRVFEPSSLREVLLNLKFIWISHLHADHHLGTVSMLLAQRQAYREERRKRSEGTKDEAWESPPQVIVASGGRMLKFLEEYESVETLGNVQQLFCDPYQKPTLAGEKSASEFLREHLGILSLQTREVEHCVGAQAISVRFQNGFKISYSGDCRPSDKFATIGKGSDVLIHEATFDDDMRADAVAKKHSTTGEALGVAAKMEAKNVILTHFSQRYQKLPVMENMKLPWSMDDSSRASDPLAFVDNLDEAGAVSNGAPTASEPKPVVSREEVLGIAGLGPPTFPMPKLDMNICVAFDYMRVRVSDIKHMKTFTPALAVLFEAEKKSIQEDTSPQEKSNMINRAKLSKKSQTGTDVDDEGHPVEDVDEPHQTAATVRKSRNRREKLS